MCARCSTDTSCSIGGLAAQGHYPPIAVLDSISRLMPAVCSPEHLQRAQLVRSWLASYRASEDLLRIGAYQKGADASLDLAVAHMPEINCLLRQGPQDSASLAGTIQALLALPT